MRCVMGRCGFVVSVLIASMSIVGCSSDEVSREHCGEGASCTTSPPESPTPSSSPLTDAPTVSVYGTTGCENFPTQTVPNVVEQNEITLIVVLAMPEGPTAAVGYPGQATTEVDAFNAAKASIALPLPAAIPNDCCAHPGPYVLRIEFASGASAVYGPCELPGNLADVASTLYDAVIEAGPLVVTR